MPRLALRPQRHCARSVPRPLRPMCLAEPASRLLRQFVDRDANFGVIDPTRLGGWFARTARPSLAR
jgi:hypothetical protein